MALLVWTPSVLYEVEWKVRGPFSQTYVYLRNFDPRSPGYDEVTGPVGSVMKRRTNGWSMYTGHGKNITQSVHGFGTRRAATVHLLRCLGFINDEDASSY